MSDATIRRKVKWDSAAKTDVGVKRSVNEDAILSRSDLGLWAVADGMGGHEVGDIASNMIIEALNQLQAQPDLQQMVDAVEDILLKTNQEILDYSEQNLDNSTIGSTIVSLVIKGRVGVALWVGDSRLYRLREGKLQRITRDHSRVEELIEQGVILPEEAKSHSESNVITRAIGVDDELCIEVCVFDTLLKDVYLLCSDGLHNTVDEQELAQIMSSNNLQTKVSQMIQRSIENGAPDNVSAIVVKGEFEKVAMRELTADTF
ncbi:PP2C family serine/threonine-protein phosphatase [Aliikangiella sp. G2MR2-5]|uniref:PP2C family protein-serine/threonine phosphatase n=1 Tax=Aliikangiella sp. G2MR2-5 TaxID=2788943 RepID=UPI0018AB7FC3|nr:protein phosphatase 2C domain-containing protein [Aliikangiella sp. G2MR2-5]